MTNPPRTSIALPDELCNECNGRLDAEKRCTNTTCFRYRPPDGEPIADHPPRLGRFLGEPPDNRYERPFDSPVSIDPAGTKKLVEEAAQAASGTVAIPLVLPGEPRANRDESNDPDDFDDDPSEKVRENPKHAAFRAVMMVIEELPTDDARKVLAAADAHLDLN